MHNIIIVNNDFKFINRMINIIYPIKDAKIKSLFYTYDNNLKATFVDFQNIYLLSEDTFFNNTTKFPKTSRIIVLVEGPIKSKINENILYVSQKVSDTTLRKNIISYLDLEPKQSLEIKIQKTLNSFKFDFTLKGTRFLYESILYCSRTNDDTLCENLQKNVFSVIAEKNATNADNVKWGIIRSINKMYSHACKTDLKKLKSYFKLDDNQKPTPKRIICTILNKLNK